MPCDEGTQYRNRNLIGDNAECDEFVKETRICNEGPCPGTSRLITLVTIEQMYI